MCCKEYMPFVTFHSDISILAYSLSMLTLVQFNYFAKYTLIQNPSLRHGNLAIQHIQMSGTSVHLHQFEPASSKAWWTVGKKKKKTALWDAVELLRAGSASHMLSALSDKSLAAYLFHWVLINTCEFWLNCLHCL